MKLILEAIKALFRKVWAKLIAMEVDTNSKLDELKKAVDALTPMVVRITGNGDSAPVVDKTLTEIVAHLKNGGGVEFVLNGWFILEGMGFFPENITLQISNWSETHVSAGFIQAGGGAIQTWSVLMNEVSVTISLNEYSSDFYARSDYFGDYA